MSFFFCADQRLDVHPKEESRTFLTFVIPHHKEPLLTVRHRTLIYVFFFFWKGKVYTKTSTNRDSSGNCKTGRGNLEYQIFNLVSQHLKRFSWTLQSRQSWRALLLKAPWCLWTCHQEQQFRSVLCNPKSTTTLKTSFFFLKERARDCAYFIDRGGGYNRLAGKNKRVYTRSMVDSKAFAPAETQAAALLLILRLWDVDILLSSRNSFLIWLCQKKLVIWEYVRILFSLIWFCLFDNADSEGCSFCWYSWNWDRRASKRRHGWGLLGSGWKWITLHFWSLWRDASASQCWTQEAALDFS